jgi:hypothetical protein
MSPNGMISHSRRIAPWSGHFRSTPMNGHLEAAPACPNVPEADIRFCQSHLSGITITGKLRMWAQIGEPAPPPIVHWQLTVLLHFRGLSGDRASAMYCRTQDVRCNNPATMRKTQRGDDNAKDNSYASWCLAHRCDDSADRKRRPAPQHKIDGPDVSQRTVPKQQCLRGVARAGMVAIHRRNIGASGPLIAWKTRPL